jgi:hypothetical protein
MSWFGGGSKDEPSETSYMTEDAHGGGGGMPPLGGGGGGGAGMQEIQQFGAQLQQQIMIQQAITDMSDRAFLKCVTGTKDSKLSGKEVACLQACTNKWLDTNELLMGRLARKGQQQQQQAGFQ